MQIVEQDGIRFAVLDENGPSLTGEAVALDVIGDAFRSDVDLIVIPKSRLPAEFLQLKTRILGEVAQKFVNYNIRVGFVGDFFRETSEHDALRDFFYETNKGGQFLFASDIDGLVALMK